MILTVLPTFKMTAPRNCNNGGLSQGLRNLMYECLAHDVNKKILAEKLACTGIGSSGEWSKGPQNPILAGSTSPRPRMFLSHMVTLGSCYTILVGTFWMPCLTTSALGDACFECVIAGEVNGSILLTFVLAEFTVARIHSHSLGFTWLLVSMHSANIEFEEFWINDGYDLDEHRRLATTGW